MRKKLLFVFAGVLILNLALKLVALSISDKSIEHELILKAAQKILLITVVMFLFRWFNDQVRFRRPYNWMIDLAAITLTLVFFGVNLYSLRANDSNHVLLISATIGTGIFEELFFRMFIFGVLFCCINTSSESRITKAAIYTSLLFGLAHLSNLINPDASLFPIANQVILAFSIGILFQGIFLKSGSIVLVICTHAIVNYLGTRHIILSAQTTQISSEYSALEVGLNLVLFSLFGAIITVIGLSMIRSAKGANVIECN